MKKLIAYILLFTLMFTLTACADAEQPITDLGAFQNQVLADYIKFTKSSKNAEFDAFGYYGTDNGYHIVLLRLAGPHESNTHKKKIAGSVFWMGGSLQLMAYRNGEFTELWLAYDYGWVSKEAIAKAAEIHNARYG